jgi:UDP-glucose 4-epimerase
VRILVTGGAGFIGSQVADRLLALGHEVAVFDNLSTGRERNLNPKARFFRADLRDEPAVKQALDEFRPEMIDHHAAQIDVRRSVEDPVFDAQTNVIGGLNLLRAAAAAGVRKVIYASTGGALYGEAQRLPADESHPVHPLSPYGISKLTFEHYLYFWNSLGALEYTILRYPNVYGPRQDPLGEAGVNAIFIGLMTAGRTPTIYGDGEQVRDYLYVEDVVEANVLALEKGSGETLNLGWGRGVSVNDVFRTLRTLLEFEGEPSYAPRRPGEVQRITLDAGRARAVLGWEPSVPFEEGLRRTLEWYRLSAAI